MSELQTPAPDGFLPGLSPRGGWFSDFEFHDGGLTVHKTGTQIRLDATLIGECLIWLGYHLIVRARSWAGHLGHPRQAAALVPDLGGHGLERLPHGQDGR